MKPQPQPLKDLLGSHGLAIEPEELQTLVRFAVNSTVGAFSTGR